MSNDEKWIQVGSSMDLGEGSMRGIEHGDLQSAIYNLEGEFYATDNICTHEYALLSEGWMEKGCIECPLHAAQFDIKTGKALSAPADTDLRVYEIKAEGADLLVKL